MSDLGLFENGFPVRAETPVCSRMRTQIDTHLLTYIAFTSVSVNKVRRIQEWLIIFERELTSNRIVSFVNNK